MESIKFSLFVSATAAVKAGKTKSGQFQVEPTEAQLAELSPREREVLAGVIHTDLQRSNTLFAPDDQPEATWGALLSALRIEVAKKDKQAAEDARQKAAADAIREQAIAEVLAAPVESLVSENYGGKQHERTRAYDGLRIDWDDARLASKRAEVDAYVKSKNDETARWRRERELQEQERRLHFEMEAIAREKQFATAAAAFVAAHGTDNQQARHKEGLLPEKELTDLIRNHLFAALKFARFDRITASEIEHRDDCIESMPHFDVEDAKELTAGQFELLAKIRKAAPPGAVVTPQVHTGHCNGCNGGSIVTRPSAHVTVEWHGRKLSRKYSLVWPRAA